MALKYKIYRCYEIVILDENDNQIGESDYCYTNRNDAKALGEHKLEEEQNNRDDGFTGAKFEVGCRYASEKLSSILITKRKGGWVWFKVADPSCSQEYKRKIYHWEDSEKIVLLHDKSGLDWLAINKEG